MAPGGERRPLGEVAAAVKEWFLHDTPLPQDWDGSSLKTVVSAIHACMYQGCSGSLRIFDVSS